MAVMHYYGRPRNRLVPLCAAIAPAARITSVADKVTCGACLEELAQKVEVGLGGSDRKLHLCLYAGDPCTKDGTMAANAGHMRVTYGAPCGRGGMNPTLTKDPKAVTCHFCKMAVTSEYKPPPFDEGTVMPLMEFFDMKRLKSRG